MKRIKYYINTPINKGVEEAPEWEDSVVEKSIPYSEANEAIAKREAHNGEYEIIDDGTPEPESEPTTDDIINAMLGVSK